MLARYACKIDVVESKFKRKLDLVVIDFNFDEIEEVKQDWQLINNQVRAVLPMRKVNVL